VLLKKRASFPHFKLQGPDALVGEEPLGGEVGRSWEEEEEDSLTEIQIQQSSSRTVRTLRLIIKTIERKAFYSSVWKGGRMSRKSKKEERRENSRFERLRNSVLTLFWGNKNTLSLPGDWFKVRGITGNFP